MSGVPWPMRRPELERADPELCVPHRYRTDDPRLASRTRRIPLWSCMVPMRCYSRSCLSCASRVARTATARRQVYSCRRPSGSHLNSCIVSALGWHGLCVWARSRQCWLGPVRCGRVPCGPRRAAARASLDPLRRATASVCSSWLVRPRSTAARAGRRGLPRPSRAQGVSALISSTLPPCVSV